MVARTLMTALLALSICTATPAAPPESGGKDGEKSRDKGTKKKKKSGRSSKKRSGKKKKVPKNLAVKAMKLVIEDAEFVDMTFDEFVEWLSRTTKANVVVRWKLLKEQGIEPDYPIELKRKNIKIRKLLSLVFKQLTEEMPSVELAAKADGNTLIISTKRDLNTKRITRVYPVQDLLACMHDFKGSSIDPSGDGRIQLRRNNNDCAACRGGCKQPKDNSHKLIKLITTHVQPLSWKVNGGKGTIKLYKGNLVVYNNLEVHQELAGAIK